MRRLEGRVIPVVLLLALSVALSSLALGPEFDPSGHYDGDEDDVGLIWKAVSHRVDVAVIGTPLTLIPSAPMQCLASGNAVTPQHVARDPLGSRAPPRVAAPALTS